MKVAMTAEKMVAEKVVSKADRKVGTTVETKVDLWVE